MSEYSEENFENASNMDDVPVKDTSGKSKPKTANADLKQVRFKTGGNIKEFGNVPKTAPKDPANYKDLPKAYKD